MERGLCRLMPLIWDVFSEMFDFSNRLLVGDPCPVSEVEPTLQCLFFSVLSC